MSPVRRHGDGTRRRAGRNRGATATAGGLSAPRVRSGNPNGTADPSVGSEARVVQISSAVTGSPTLYVSRDVKLAGTPNDQTDIRALTSPTGVAADVAGRRW